MDKNKEVDNFLNGLEEPVTDPFKAEENPFEEEKEEGGESEEVSSEEDKESKPEPFHKDPKVQRYVQKQIEKALSGYRPEIDVSEVQKFAKESGADEDEVVEALTGLIGNDTPEKKRVLAAMSKAFKTAEEKGAERAMRQIEERQQQSVQADRQADEELSQGFEDIEEEFDVDLTSNTSSARRTRNEFIDFIQRVAPKDEHGQVTEFPDFSEAFSVFQDTQKSQEKSKTVNRAKELSSKSMGRSSGDVTTPTNTDKSWNAVDRLFSKFNS